jgi:membrane protease YdiL (CAAX protease family)
LTQLAEASIGVVRSQRGFTRWFLVALALGTGAAVVLAPLAADAVAGAGLRIPFPRIFDRVVMITLAAAMLLLARRLGLMHLLRDGFDNPRRTLPQLLIGAVAALAVMASLFAVAIAIAHPPLAIASLLWRALRYAPAALLIGLIEEAFFRAILLGGIAQHFGIRAALIVSAAIYALAHLVRSPRHYYLTGFHPAAGFENLVASLARIAHPDDLVAMMVGLFLLGLVLGTAFVVTGRVYLSVGLHAGFVIGAKCWPLVAVGANEYPRWLAGPGPIPLIAAPAAWAAALALLVVIALVGRSPYPFLSS